MKDDYRAHLRHVTNELHRKMTGLNTGSSRYKGLYGRWCQAQEDLAAYEQMGEGEDAGGGLQHPRYQTPSYE